MMFQLLSILKMCFYLFFFAVFMQKSLFTVELVFLVLACVLRLQGEYALSDVFKCIDFGFNAHFKGIS